MTRCITSKVLQGNAVLLRFQFRNFNNELLQVDNIHFTLYDVQSNKLIDEDITTTVVQPDVGTYEYIFQAPRDVRSVVAEISTTYEGELPLLTRRAINLVWSRN